MLGAATSIGGNVRLPANLRSTIQLLGRVIRNEGSLDRRAHCDECEPRIMRKVSGSPAEVQLTLTMRNQKMRTK